MENRGKENERSVQEYWSKEFQHLTNRNPGKKPTENIKETQKFTRRRDVLFNGSNKMKMVSTKP